MWIEFLCHWSLWAIYIAQFSMNWSNYIIMQWLPTYLSRNLGANKESISFTAVPYIINSLVGVGKEHIDAHQVVFISLLCIHKFTFVYFRSGPFRRHTDKSTMDRVICSTAHDWNRSRRSWYISFGILYCR